MSSYAQILGLDLSLTDTGMVVIAKGGEKWTVIAKASTGKHTVDTTDPLRQLIVCDLIYHFAKTYLSRHLKTAIAIEDYAFGSRLGKSFTRAELGGMVKAMFLTEFKYSIYLIAPTALKRFMGVAGRGTNKDDMFDAASRQFHFTNTNHNIVDAYCLARYLAANKEGQRLTLVRNDPLPQYNRSTVQAPAPKKLPIVPKIGY